MNVIPLLLTANLLFPTLQYCLSLSINLPLLKIFTILFVMNVIILFLFTTHSGKRPHLQYGSLESAMRLPPLILHTLQLQTFLHSYHPLEGNLQEVDRTFHHTKNILMNISLKVGLLFIDDIPFICVCILMQLYFILM